MEERRLGIMQQQRPGTIGEFTGSGSYDAAKGVRDSSFRYWDGDTFVQETLRNHKGHELTIVERIRSTRSAKSPSIREITFHFGESPGQ